MGSSFRQTIASLFSRPEMSAQHLLSGHLQSPLARVAASEHEYIIAAQDTTYYNYSGQSAMTGIGTIQGKVRGLLQHTVLLLDEAGRPLGLLAQQYWTRQGGKDLPAGKKRARSGTKA